MIKYNNKLRIIDLYSIANVFNLRESQRQTKTRKNNVYGKILPLGIVTWLKDIYSDQSNINRNIINEITIIVIIKRVLYIKKYKLNI